MAGNYYDMGQQHASKLFHHRAALLSLISDHREKIKSYDAEISSKLIHEAMRVIEDHSPQTLDMIRGIADGFRVAEKDVLWLLMDSYIEDQLSPPLRTRDADDGCTTWVISKGNGEERKTLLAKNRDYLISHRSLQIIFRCKPEGGIPYLCVNSVGACNVFSSGMNAEGLAIADTRVPSADAGPGLPRYSLMMHVLENFHSVDEVVGYLRSVPRMGGGNLIFADRYGNIGSAEIGYENLDVLQREKGFLVCTNHFEGPTLRKRYRPKDPLQEQSSKKRFEKVSRDLLSSAADADPNFAFTLMAYHGDGFAICNHEGPDGTATISSTVFIPEKRGLFYCEGFPCSQSYQWISF
jgi:isopenicillin-N N-acyltransferase-like protein